MNNTEAVKFATLVVHAVLTTLGLMFWGWNFWPWVLMYFGVTTPLWLIYVEMKHYNSIMRKWLNLR